MLWQKTGKGKNLNLKGRGIEKKFGKIYTPTLGKSGHFFKRGLKFESFRVF